MQVLRVRNTQKPMLDIGTLPQMPGAMTSRTVISSLQFREQTGRLGRYARVLERWNA